MYYDEMGWVYIEEQKFYYTAVLGFSAMKAKRGTGFPDMDAGM